MKGKYEILLPSLFLLSAGHGWEKRWVFIVPSLVNSILAPSFTFFFALFYIITTFWIIINPPFFVHFILGLHIGGSFLVGWILHTFAFPLWKPIMLTISSPSLSPICRRSRVIICATFWWNFPYSSILCLIASSNLQKWFPFFVMLLVGK